MRLDWTISGACHLIVLGTALISFAPTRVPNPMIESIPINIVSNTDKSQITQGQLDAAQQKKKQQFAERIAEPKAVETPAAKVVKAKEIKASTDAPPPAPQPAQKQVAAKKKPEPKHDLIAEALKKDEAKKAEQKKAEVKAPKRLPQEQPKFDARKLEALLDRRLAQRQEATGSAVSDTVSLGTPRASAATLTQSELDALRARLAQLWNPPAGAQNPQELVVQVRMRLKPDGTLNGPPIVMTSGQSTLFMAARDSAIRAVFRAQPFDMLKPENYEEWKDIEITFDPRDMIRG